MAKTTLKQITCGDGERSVLLVDETGIPLYFPNLFITTQVRSASMATGTIKMALIALQVLERWQLKYQVDLVSRFRSGQFLKDHEFNSIRDFSQKKQTLDKEQSFKNNVIFLASNKNYVSRNTHYQRMTVIAKYLSFLATTVNGKLINKEIKADIDYIENRMKALRPRQQSPHKLQAVDRALSNQTIERLYEVTRQFSPDNPFDENVRFRNVLIIELLSSLGLRKGELANIRLDDINFQDNTLKVVRRPDDKSDSRHYQPVVKTAERTLPISKELSQLIQDYQLRQRGRMPAARKHGYLFVSHKGSTLGLPLSVSGIDYIFKQLKLAVNDRSLSPHKLRHQWNYEFSKLIDGKDNALSEQQEEQMRSYLMGWSPTSGMAANYNRRRIVERAHGAIKEHQNRLSRMKDRSDAEQVE